MEEIKTGFSIICNWCGSNEATLKPISSDMCLLECLDPDCMETVHIMTID